MPTSQNMGHLITGASALCTNRTVAEPAFEGGPYREPEPTIDARELAELREEVEALEKRLRRTQALLRQARWWAQIGFTLAVASWTTEIPILAVARWL
jgi:hypothetical protein